VRLIDGEDTEIVPREEAERRAQETGLDLLIVSLDASPLVVRLIDYGKFKYELEKKQREAKKKQHVTTVKEIKMGVRIDDNDYNVKVDRARRFLEDHDKVKLTIRLKGREIQHNNLAFDLANQFVIDLEPCGTLEGRVRMEGRAITVNLSPKTSPSGAKKPTAPAPTTTATSTTPSTAPATPAYPHCYDFEGNHPTMPKMKTHRAGQKRYRLTAGGKLVRNCSGRSHLNGKKTSDRKRRLDSPTLVHETCIAKIRLELPYLKHARR
jgi:translation initiation factor IF-3